MKGAVVRVTDLARKGRLALREGHEELQRQRTHLHQGLGVTPQSSEYGTHKTVQASALR